MAAPVTIWTSGSAEQPTGLTIGSVLIAEGEPSHVLGLINDLTDLYERISETGGFVVHVLGREDRVLADRFAGLWPAPGGPFADLEVTASERGPAIAKLVNRAYCRVVDITGAGYQRLARGEIERLELGPLEDPLIHFRGRYRGLSV